MADYEIRYLENAGAMPLEGEFSPEALTPPYAALMEAKLDKCPWGGDYRPDCRARVGWNEKGLHVLMYAQEREIRAEVTEIGGGVCADSCLEFFLSPDASAAKYVNCEVNPLCVMHIGLGEGRHNRTVLRSIPEGFNATHSLHQGGWWAVSYTIPASFLKEHFGVTLKKGMKMRGNFYKCGDDTAHVHYLMFKPYDTPKPDYHRPEQFAEFVLA